MAHRSKTRFFESNAGGFSLVEVIIAMMLLGLVSLSFTAAFGFAFVNTSRSGVRQQKATQAKTEMLTHLSNTSSSQYISNLSTGNRTDATARITSSTWGSRDVEGTYKQISVPDEYGSTVDIIVFVPVHKDRDVWP